MLAAILSFLANLLKIFVSKPSAVQVEAEKAGQATEAAQVSQQAANDQAAVAQAEAQAPKTSAELVDRLNKGTF